MQIFQASNGFVFSFGFDMEARRPDPRSICWCDPGTMEWSPSSKNMAGSVRNALDLAICPEFIRETREGVVVAYQPGFCIELTYVGHPAIWSVKILRAE